jgi:hypothetical protein
MESGVMTTGRRKRALRMLEPTDGQSAPQTSETVATGADLAEGIPAHVWELLSEAGELAAERLRDILRSPRFKSFRPSEQRALIDLALTRAYGLPVRRSLSVSLSSSDTDAIAASLMGLQDALPERGNEPLQGGQDARDVTPGGQGTKDP